MPSLTGNGDLSPGSATGFTITLANAQQNQLAFLLVGLASNPTPFKGGTLYPFPIAVMTSLYTDGFGVASLSASIPSGVPSGSTIVFQTWMSDGTAPKGMSGSNGLEAIVP